MCGEHQAGGQPALMTKNRFSEQIRFMDGDADAIHAYRGEYMNVNSMASLTEVLADRATWENHKAFPP